MSLLKQSAFLSTKNINVIKNDYENTMRAQKERIFQLREENRRLTLALDAYKLRESAIASAMIDSYEQADAIIKQAKRKAERSVDEINIRYMEILDKKKTLILDVNSEIETLCKKLYSMKVD